MFRFLAFLIFLLGLSIFLSSNVMAYDPRDLMTQGNSRLSGNNIYRFLNSANFLQNMSETEWKTVTLEIQRDATGVSVTFDKTCPYEIVTVNGDCSAKRAQIIRALAENIADGANISIGEAENIASNLIDIKSLSDIASLRGQTLGDAANALTGNRGANVCFVRKLPVYDVYLQGVVSLVYDNGDVKIHPIASYYVSWKVNGNTVTACVAVKTIDDKLLGCSCEPGGSCTNLSFDRNSDRLVAELKIIRRCFSLKEMM